VERVVMGAEGLGGGASGDGVHHRGFDFEVASVVEEGAQGTENGSALDEDLADVAGLGFGGLRGSLWRLAQVFNGTCTCYSFRGGLWRFGRNAGVLRFAQN